MGGISCWSEELEEFLVVFPELSLQKVVTLIEVSLSSPPFSTSFSGTCCPPGWLSGFMVREERERK